MVEEETESTEQLVTLDHCNLVSLRIEGKLDRLIEIFEPKSEMIVRVDSSMKWIKGIVVFVFSGGILTAAYKLFTHFTSTK